MEMDTSSPDQEQLDELLYSRQIHALGRDAMQKIRSGNVLVLGLKGIGAEVAKNVILAGVQKVTIVDDETVQAEDLSTNFLLQRSDVGSERASACLPRLQELNSDVKVQSACGPFSAELLEICKEEGRPLVVVATNSSWTEADQVNMVCREKGALFIAAVTHGLFGYVFDDFGDEFAVTETSGEPPPTLMVESITQDCPATVTIGEEHRHGFEPGDCVVFSGIKGMDALNNTPPRPVTIAGPASFTIPDDTTLYSRYISGGYIHRVRPPRVVSFKSLQWAIRCPDLQHWDPSQLDRAAQLHAAFEALAVFQQRHAGASPKPTLEEDAAELIAIAEEAAARRISSLSASTTDSNPDTNGSIANGAGAHLSGLELTTPVKAPVTTFSALLAKGGGVVDTSLLRALVGSLGAELSPMNSIVGGIAAQEVLKGCSGASNPIQQWLYLDALEGAPEGGVGQEARAAGGRSGESNQAAIFGSGVAEKLKELNYLVVGAGGVGCEVLKNLALMGVGSHPSGSLTIADGDIVERSNLCGQMLYRRSDIGTPKAVAAAAAVAQINPSVKCKSLQEYFNAETEGTFSSSMLEKLSGVCSGLDDSSSRLYLDARCVAARKPMIDGGKLGYKGSVQVFVPHQSEMYASTRDPPEHSETPICTLRNFPYATEHTLRWAVDTFESLFKARPADVNAYLSRRDFLEGLKKNPSTRLPTLESLRDALVKHRPLSFEACIEWARHQFEELFSSAIKQLCFNFPASMTTTGGTPFWSGTKKAPTPLAFSSSEPLHMDFVVAAANLQAAVYGLKGCRDLTFFKEVLRGVNVPEFTPKEGVRIAVSDDQLRGGGATGPGGVAIPDEAEAHCSAVLSEMPTPATLAGYRLTPIDYHKDDETKCHFDFVLAAANLRASNYGIPKADPLIARLIAGHILPSVVTASAVVGGLMCLELYKLVQGKPLEAFRHSFFNLGVPLFCSATPLEAVKSTVETAHGKPLVWTLWDRFEMEGNGVTLEKFLEEFKERQGLEITMLSFGKSLLYAEFLPKKKMADRMAMTLVELVTQVGKATVPESETQLTFSVACSDCNDNDVEVPDVVVRIG